MVRRQRAGSRVAGAGTGIVRDFFVIETRVWQVRAEDEEEAAELAADAPAETVAHTIDVKPVAVPAPAPVGRPQLRLLQ
jgi:hypothetical protein